MSGFFGKIKNFFDFREMNKLVKGEFFKFVKSSTFYVLTAAVIILAVVTGLIYNPDSDGWGGFQDMLGGTVSTEDYFTYLNGAEYLEYVDRYELDIPYIDYIEANKAFTRETKYQYLTSSPQSYHMALNPVSKIKDTSAEYNSFFETPVDYLYGDNDATAGLGSMQKFILADFAFFDVFLKQGETYAEKKDFISGLFKNNDVQNIELELQNYGAQLFESEAKLSLVVTDSAVLNMLKDSVVKTKLVRIMKDVFSHPEGESAYEAFIYYRLYFLPLHDHIYYNSQNTYNNVMNNLNRAKLFFYYAQDSGYTVSIADFVKRTILGYGEAFDDLEDALYTTEMERKKEGNDYKYTEESVKNLYETYKKFIALYGMSRNMIAAGLNVGVNFLFFVTGADSGSLVSSIISPAPQVYKDFNDRHNVINEEINTTNASLNENLSFKNVYEAISGFFDTLVLDNLIFTKEGIDLQTRMTETLAVVDESLKITMDDKIYGESFSFIEDRVDVLLTESTLLTKDNIVGKYYGEYYRGELLQALSQGYALPYAAVDEYFKLAQRLVIEGGYINDYLKLKNLSLIVDKENFTDADLSNIYGIFNFLIVGTSKYSLKSDISEIVFMLDNRESIGSLTSPLGMDRGYAFMIFVFNILYLLLIAVGIVIGAGTIAGEHSTGTIKLLLIRPYKRWKFLLSKILMSMIVMVGMFIMSFVLLYLIGGLFWGFGSNYNVLVMFDASKVMIMKPFTVMLLMFFFYFLECMIYMLIAVMVSTIFKSKSGAIAISMAIYFAANVLIIMLSSNSWFKYVLFNNTNLFFYMSTGPTLNDMTFGFSLIVDIIYVAIVLVSTFWVFTKKDAN